MRSVAVVLLSLLATACGSSLPHPTFAPQPTTALVEVDQAPPPARVELVPTRPAAATVWIDGEWIWRRGRWAWLTGRWVAAPADAQFSAWVFLRGADGRMWSAPGTWRDASGVPIEMKALTMASVQAGAVVDADGTSETTGPILHDRPHTQPPAQPDAAVVAPGNP